MPKHDFKLPEKGELVLVFQEAETEKADEVFDQYRRHVLIRQARVRRAIGIKLFQRHLQVYQPVFIVKLPS